MASNQYPVYYSAPPAAVYSPAPAVYSPAPAVYSPAPAVYPPPARYSPPAGPVGYPPSARYSPPYEWEEEYPPSITKPKTWCWPFIVYVILVIISLIIMIFTLMTNNLTGEYIFMTMIIWLVFHILIGWLVYYLCSIGKTGWAWFVVFLPIILSLIFLFFTIFAFGLGATTGVIVD